MPLNIRLPITVFVALVSLQQSTFRFLVTVRSFPEAPPKSRKRHGKLSSREKLPGKGVISSNRCRRYAQALAAKGTITQQELLQTILRERATYKRMLNPRRQ